MSQKYYGADVSEILPAPSRRAARNTSNPVPSVHTRIRAFMSDARDAAASVFSTSQRISKKERRNIPATNFANPRMANRHELLRERAAAAGGGGGGGGEVRIENGRRQEAPADEQGPAALMMEERGFPGVELVSSAAFANDGGMSACVDVCVCL